MNRILCLALAVSCGSSSPAVKKPSAPGWTELAPMLAGRGEAAVAALDGKIYVMGGYNTSRTFQIYDIAADAWTQGPPLLAGTDNAAAIAYGGKIYLFGGEAGPALRIYDPGVNAWGIGP